jgi:hypothetical protein
MKKNVCEVLNETADPVNLLRASITSYWIMLHIYINEECEFQIKTSIVNECTKFGLYKIWTERNKLRHASMNQVGLNSYTTKIFLHFSSFKAWNAFYFVRFWKSDIKQAMAQKIHSFPQLKKPWLQPELRMGLTVASRRNYNLSIRMFDVSFHTNIVLILTSQVL